MSVYSTSYDTLRQAVHNAVPEDSPEVDGVGYRSLANVDADALLMHAADTVISNYDVNDACYGNSDADLVLEYASNSGDNEIDFKNISDEEMAQVEAVTSRILKDFNATHSLEGNTEKLEVFDGNGAIRLEVPSSAL
ncbi:hypothetical protein G3A39_40820 [Paraburkholderia aspalathi]|nr:hypothetical protein [Paraburkholderia aspalathi]